MPHSATQNARARKHASSLQRQPRRHIVTATASGRNVSAFPRDSLQLLHEQASQTSTPVRGSNFHVDVSIRRVIVKEEPARSDNVTFLLKHPVTDRFRSVREYLSAIRLRKSTESRTGYTKVRRCGVREKYGVACYVRGTVPEQQRQQTVIGLRLDRGCPGFLDHASEERQRQPAAVRKYEELFQDNAWFSRRSSDRAVSDEAPVDFQDVRIREPAFVPRIVHDLAVHLAAILFAHRRDLAEPNPRYLNRNIQRQLASVYVVAA